MWSVPRQKDDQRVIGKMNVQTESSIGNFNILGVGNGFIERKKSATPLISLRTPTTVLLMKIENTHLTRLVLLHFHPRRYPIGAASAPGLWVGMAFKRKASDAGTVSRARRRIESITDYCDASPRTDALGSILWPASGEAIEDARNFIRAW